MNDIREAHPQTLSLNSFAEFLRRRCSYYGDKHIIGSNELTRRLFLKRRPEFSVHYRLIYDSASAIRKMNPSLVILTTTKNRLQFLLQTLNTLLAMRGRINWAWVVVDNESTDGTESFLQSINDKRIVYVRCGIGLGYAAPVRNFGLDVVHFALGREPGQNRYLLIVDSDDTPFDEYSIKEVFIMKRRSKSEMAHGYVRCEYLTRESHYYDTIPRTIENHRFPTVPNMREELEAGPNILSAILPMELLSWMRYPNDFTFEDDTLNQKILLHYIKRREVWSAIEYPVLLKRFHSESMSCSNEDISPKKKAKIGEWTVSGVRAHLVERLYELRDWFTRENL